MARFAAKTITTPQAPLLQLEDVENICGVTSRTSWQVRSASFGMHILSVPRPCTRKSLCCSIHPGLLLKLHISAMHACHPGRPAAGFTVFPAGTNPLSSLVPRQSAVQGHVCFEVLSILQDCSTVVMVQQHASGAEAGMLQCLPQPSRSFPAGALLCRLQHCCKICKVRSTFQNRL